MKENKKQINENSKINNYITVLQGYLNNEEIECKTKGTNDDWIPVKNPTFDFASMEYRIKPKQYYRPYISGNEAFVEIHEHTPYGWLYNTKTMLYEQVLCIGDNGIYTHDDDYSYEQAFDTFIYPNDEKFGIKLDNNEKD